jgi:hypothetical protein
MPSSHMYSTVIPCAMYHAKWARALHNSTYLHGSALYHLAILTYRSSCLDLRRIDVEAHYYPNPNPIDTN